MSVFMFLYRQCATNQYLRKRDDPHRYCQGLCAEVTKCGPVIVPEDHLQVSSRYDALQFAFPHHCIWPLQGAVLNYNY